MARRIQPTVKTVKRTIEYYYQGDGQAAPSVEQKVTFTRTGDRDRVTGATTWEDWSKVAAQNVEQKDSPRSMAIQLIN